jgi:hypothetical protein
MHRHQRKAVLNPGWFLTLSFQVFANNVSMYMRLDWGRRALPVVLSVVSLAAVGALFVWDIRPELLPARSHDLLGAFSLAMIALAYMAYQVVHRPPIKELVKAILLAVAFLFWAANQLWPDSHLATLFNDIAISLFVFDVFLVIIGWPSSSPDSSFAETCTCCEQGCNSNGRVAR